MPHVRGQCGCVDGRLCDSRAAPTAGVLPHNGARLSALESLAAVAGGARRPRPTWQTSCSSAPRNKGERLMWIAERGKDLEFSELVDPNTTALIVIDVQNDFCEQAGAYGRAGNDASPMPAVAEKLRKLVATARARQV